LFVVSEYLILNLNIKYQKSRNIFKTSKKNRRFQNLNINHAPIPLTVTFYTGMALLILVDIIRTILEAINLSERAEANKGLQL